jgi:hypothetical protein
MQKILLWWDSNYYYNPSNEKSNWEIFVPLLAGVVAFIANIVYKEVSRRREIIERTYSEIYANCDIMLISAALANHHSLIYRGMSFSYQQSVPSNNPITPAQLKQEKIGHDYDLPLSIIYLNSSNAELDKYNKALIELNKSLYFLKKYSFLSKNANDLYNYIITDEDKVHIVLNDYTDIYKAGMTDKEFKEKRDEEWGKIHDFVYKGEVGKKLTTIKNIIRPEKKI